MKNFKDQFVGVLFYNDEVCDNYINLVKLVFFKQTNVKYILKNNKKVYLLITDNSFYYIDDIQLEIDKLQILLKKQEEEFNTCQTDKDLVTFFTVEDNNIKDIRKSERNIKKKSNCDWLCRKAKTPYQMTH